MALSADYVVVGSGLTGATVARLLADAGRDVVVLEARDRVGGNVADAVHPSGIRHNLYGPHYFRTSAPRIADYVQRFAEFYPFAATILSQVGSQFYPWPLQRSTFDEFGGDEPRASVSADSPRNFEEAMLANVPRRVYETFIGGYSAKQWGVPPTELDTALATRIDVREDGDARLSKASFQALPAAGFTAWVASMLADIPVHLNTDYHECSEPVRWRRALIYTGPIDRFFGYEYGALPYRSQERVDLFIPGTRFVYGCGQINLPSLAEGKQVRTIEWRHMLAPGEGPEDGTLLTIEVPMDAPDWRTAEYPFPSAAARAHYERYAALAAGLSDIVLCGRLGEYRYLDMDQAIGRAMVIADRLLEAAPS